MRHCITALLHYVMVVTVFAGTAKVLVDTKSHLASIEDESSIIDASNITLTINGFTVKDASGIKTINLGSTSGTKITGKMIFFDGTTPIAKPTGSVIVALSALHLLGSPTINFNELTGVASTGQIPSLDWSKITSGKPTTIGGYGIGDFNSLGDARWPQLSGNYTNPAWIASIDWSKITGAQEVSTESYAGANVGARITAALAALPSTGGIIVVENGNQTISADALAGSTKPVTIKLGVGIYTLTCSGGDCLTLHASQRIIGSGQGVTVLKVTGQTAFAIIEASPPDIEIADLTIDGSGGGNSFSYGIVAANGTRPSIHNVAINSINCTGAQIYIYNCTYGKFHDIDIRENGQQGHGFILFDPAPSNDYHELSNITVFDGYFGFHLVQSNRNTFTNCIASASGFNSLEGFNLDSSNENIFVNIAAWGRGDAGFIEVNGESFTGTPPCARNQITGGIFGGNANNGMRVNGIDETYRVTVFNNGQSGNSTEGIYLAGTRQKLSAYIFDNQNTVTQTTGVYVNTPATDARIVDASFYGAMTNKIVDLGTRTIASYYDETLARLILPKSRISQESWLAPSLQNSWVTFGGGQDVDVGYMKDSLGFIHLQGRIKNGVTTNGVLAWTMPAGYRPVGRQVLMANSNGTPCQVIIGTDGTVTLWGANATEVDFAGGSYSTQ